MGRARGHSLDCDIPSVIPKETEHASVNRAKSKQTLALCSMVLESPVFAVNHQWASLCEILTEFS